MFKPMILSTLFWVAACFGQEPEVADASVFDLSLDELMESVVVSAQKRDEDPLTVPISMVVITDKMIPRLAAERVMDLEYLVPNFNQGRGMSPSRGEVSIRGISDYSRNIGYDQRAGVYLDGAWLGRSSTINKEFLELSRIEFLRGPQGTLFGKNTVSGAINLVSVKPQNEFGADVRQTVGNAALSKSVAAVNAPLIRDRLMVRAAVSKTARDGFITNTYNGLDLNGRDSTAARFRLRFLASQRLEVNLAMDRFREDARIIDTVALDGTGPLVVNHDAMEFERRDLEGVNLTLDYRLNSAAALTYIGSYRESHWVELNEEDYTALFISESTLDESSRHHTHELRLHQDFEGGIDVVVGYYHLDQTIRTQRVGVFGPVSPLPNSSVVTPGRSGVVSNALFAHANIPLHQTLILTGGVRYTNEKKSILHQVIDTSGFFLNTRFEDAEEWRDLSPKIGLNYQPNQDHMVYLTLSRAYKSGGWNADFLTSQAQLDRLLFDQESADNVELGWKARLLQERLWINTAVFRMDFDDYQVFQFQQPTPGSTILALSNAGEVKNLGAELDVRLRPHPHVVISGGLGLANAVFKRFADGGGPGVDYDGHRLPFAPRDTRTLAVDYECPLSDLGSMVVRGEYSRTDHYYTNPNNSPRYFVPDYEVYNLWMTYTTANRRWSVSVFGRNLSDKVHLRSRGESFLGVTRASYNEPRTYGLTCRYRY